MNIDLRLLRYIKKYKIPFLITILLGVLGAGFVISQAAILSRVISQVFLHNRELSSLYPLLMLFFALAVVRAICSWQSRAFAQKLAAAVKSDLSDRVVDNLFRQGNLILVGTQAY